MVIVLLCFFLLSWGNQWGNRISSCALPLLHMPLGSARHYQESSVHLFTALKKESSQTSTLHDNAFKIKYSSSWRNLLWLFFYVNYEFVQSCIIVIVIIIILSVFCIFKHFCYFWFTISFQWLVIFVVFELTCRYFSLLFIHFLCCVFLLQLLV